MKTKMVLFGCQLFCHKSLPIPNLRMILAMFRRFPGPKMADQKCKGGATNVIGKNICAFIILRIDDDNTYSTEIT